jgi:hypothetical protein
VDVTRVLHLVRGALPAGVVGPDDLVVYTAEAEPRAAALASGAMHAAAHRIWILDDRPDSTIEKRITSAELCDLVFELDCVAVW